MTMGQLAIYASRDTFTAHKMVMANFLTIFTMYGKISLQGFYAENRGPVIKTGN